MQAEVQRLRKTASARRASLDNELAKQLEREYGPACPYTETLDFKILDEDLDDQLKTFDVSRLSAFLLEQRGTASVREITRGYWGDMTLLGFAQQEITPPLNGDWTQMGSLDAADGLTSPNGPPDGDADRV